jgi:hypothetical protein
VQLPIHRQPLNTLLLQVVVEVLAVLADQAAVVPVDIERHQGFPLLLALQSQ